MERKLRERYGDMESTVIYNGYVGEPNVENRESEPVGMRNPIRVVYTGTIYPGIRDPSALFKALKRVLPSMQKARDDLEIIFAGSCEAVNDLAMKYGVEKYVSVLGRVGHTEAIELQKSADVLLYIDCLTDSQTGVVGGKLFEYLICGKPIFCINAPKNGEVAEIIATSNSGHVFYSDDLDGLEGFVRRLLEGDDVRMRINSEYVSAFSRESSARKLYDGISQLMRSPQEL